jgi:hypothetical protein
LKKYLEIFLFVSIFMALVSCQAVSSGGQYSTSRNLTTDATSLPDGLIGVGVNTTALWSGASNVSSPSSFASHISVVDELGFDHLTIIACADWIINLACKKRFQNETNIISYVRAAVSSTDLHIVLSLKAYAGQQYDGVNASYLQEALRDNEEARAEFVASWQRIAQALSDIPASRLSFTLLNEPEFERPAPSRVLLERWETLASSAIEAIRQVSPDRTIIYGGIAKSSWSRRYMNGSGYKYPDVSTIMRPLPYDNVVYAGHSYEPFAFTQQASYRGYPAGRPFSDQHRQVVQADARRLINWSRQHNVPVILGEFGCIGYTDGKTEGPVAAQDCGQYADTVYRAYVENGVGITWWSLEKEKTFLIRPSTDACAEREQCPIWMPQVREPDPFILQGLRLRE